MSLRWKRVLAVALVMAVIVGGLLLLPVARDAYNARQARLADEPHPLPASEAEQAAILVALVRGGEMRVFEDPPLPGGNPSPSPLAALFESTFPLCADDAAFPGVGCREDSIGGSVPMDRLKPERTPFKLRRELVLANRTPRRVADPHIPALAMASLAEVRAAYGDAQFFRGTATEVGDRPLPDGYVEVSTAVLTPDRREALIVVANGCGPDCRIIGNLYRLVRGNDDWQVVDEQMIWNHVY